MSFWAAFYAVAIPVLLIGVTWAILNGLREAWGDPPLEGHLLYSERSVRTQASGKWPGRRHLWVTDQGLIVKLRGDFHARQGLRTQFYPPSRIHSVSVVDGMIKVDLSSDAAPSSWTFQSAHPAQLERAIRTLLR